MITSPNKVIKTGIPIPPVGEPRINKWAYVFNKRATDEAWGVYEEKVRGFYRNIEDYFKELFFIEYVERAVIDFREHDVDYVLSLSNGMCIHRTIPALFFLPRNSPNELLFSIKEVTRMIEMEYKNDPH